MNLSELLSQTLHYKASDLHLSVGSSPILRVDGDLQGLNTSLLTQENLEQLLHPYLDEQQQNLFKEQHELDFVIEIPSLTRFRVNIFQQQQGIAAALRIIPPQIPNLIDLNLLNVFHEISKLTHGLVLITGATGSGKSTTLAAVLNEINQTQAKHIITIEDPIEFLHQSQRCLINQRQVHRDTQSFETALRSALREDPDIILVGELRDLQTIRLALTAAETGHLVLATLHTTSAAKTINRIVDVFPGDEKNLVRNLLSESLQAVVCQRLIPKIQGGRVAALEIMLATPAIRNAIREDKISQMISTIQTSKHLGMQTLDQHLQSLVQQQIILAESVHF